MDRRVVITIERVRGTKFVRVGRLTAAAIAGANKTKFSGKFGKRRLERGSYRATLVATDRAGNASAPKRLKLRVL